MKKETKERKGKKYETGSRTFCSLNLMTVGVIHKPQAVRF